MPIVPVPVKTDYTSATGAAITVANGVDTVMLTATDVSTIENYTVFVRNLGGGGAANFQNAALQASYLAAGPWVAINTSFAALASGVDAIVSITDNSNRFIRVIAQGNGGTTTGAVFFQGVRYTDPE